MRIATLTILLSLCAILAACAPRMRSATEPAPLPEEEARAANREALVSLMESTTDVPDTPTPRATSTPNQTATNTLPVLPVTVLEPPASDAELGEGRIARDELRTFVEQGPHFLFRAVELEPVLNGERFQGYRVAALAPEPEAIAASGLRIGDVVTAVNGTDISNPDAFMRVWDQLPDANALTVEIVRAGDPRTLAWNIR